MVPRHNENLLTMDIIAYLQVLIIFALLSQFMLEEDPTQDDALHELVMQTTEEY